MGAWLASFSSSEYDLFLEQKTTAFAESLSGLIERVTYFYDVTGFDWLKTKGHHDLVTLIGTLVMEQYMLLQRNVVYTGIARGKKLVVLKGQKQALAIAVKNNRAENRF